MSHKNLEIVRRALELLRDSYENGEATDGLLDLCAPDIRIDATRRIFNPEVYEGLAGVERSIRDTCDSCEDFEVHTERLIDAGERVVAIQTLAGRGRARSADVQQKGAMIWNMRDGLVELIEVFIDPRDALAAIGVSEG